MKAPVLLIACCKNKQTNKQNQQTVVVFDKSCARLAFFIYTRLLWSAICFKIMARYTCGFFPRILAIIPATRYLCVFLSRILAFYSQVYDYFLTNAHIYAHKKNPYISVTNKHVVYAVAESRRIRDTELYRQQKNPPHVRWSWKVTSVWIKHGRNARVHFEQNLVLIHCPHSSSGCGLPDNGFVGIRGLSLEKLCTLFQLRRKLN